MESIYLESELDPFDEFFGPTTNYVFLCDEQEASNQIFTSSENQSPVTAVNAQVEPDFIKEEEDTPITTIQETVTHDNIKFNEEGHSGQSKLHNCPKHLVKFLAQALDLNRLDRLDYASTFGDLTVAGRAAIRGLLELLQMAHKGKIKSTSKELLKIVFQNGVQHNKKFRLLGNSKIRNYFETHDQASINQAKNRLRCYAVERLLQHKSSFIEDSRIIRKDINEKYVSIFIRELQEGTIKERISKIDKLRIFESCENF